MPRRISAEEAARLGAVPVEEPRRKMTAGEAAEAGAVPLEGDALGVADSPLRKALAADPGDVVEVQTPTGPVKFDRQGRRVFSSEESQQAIDAGGARFNEAGLERILATAGGGSLGLEAPISGALAKLGGGDFDKAANAARDAVASATKNVPMGYPILGGVLASGPAAPATIPGRLALGAGLGGVSGYNRAKPGEGMRGTALGAGFGLAGGAVGEGVGAGLAKLGRALAAAPESTRKFFIEQVIRALNPGKRDIASLERAPPVNGKPMLEAVGEDLMQSGVVKPWQRADELAEGVAGLAETRGKKIGEYLDAHEAMDPNAVQPDVVAQRIEADVVAPFAAEASSTSQSAAGIAQREADLIRAMKGASPMSLKASEELIKRPHGEAAAKYARTLGTPPAQLEAQKGVYSAVKRQNEDAAQAAIDAAAVSRDYKRRQASMDVRAIGDFPALKSQYGLAEQASRIAEANSPKLLANRAVSPSDMGFGIATGQAYQPPALPALPSSAEGVLGSLGKTALGALGSLGHRALRERGNTTAAVGAYSALPLVRAFAPTLSKLPAGLGSAMRSASPGFGEAAGSSAAAAVLSKPKDQADEDAIAAWLGQ